MIVYRRGQSLGWRSLGGVLRYRHEELAREQERSLELRRKRRVPETEGEDQDEPATLLGPYRGLPELDHVRIKTIAMSAAEVAEIQQIGTGPEADFSGACREALRKALRGLQGIEDESGAVELAGVPDDELLDLLEDNGLLGTIFAAVMYVQGLSGEQKKTVGVSPPSTSESTTARPAQDPCEQPEAATGAGQ